MTGGRVVIAGATGFIGRALVRELAAGPYDIVALVRRDPSPPLPAGVVAALWDGVTAGDWTRHVNGALAVINVTGDNLARGRWTKAKKDRILTSRTRPAEALIKASLQAASPPRVLIQASAVGYYGSPGETEVDESSPAGEGFLAGVVREWEASTVPFEAPGLRRAVVRSGLVLGRGGGVWPSLVRPFQFFAGGPIGDGRQWFSWIALEDEARAIRFLVEREDLAGAFNLTAPRPLRQRDLCRTIGRALRRPCWLPVPACALRLLFGGKADETLLVSQRVFPRRLVGAGFEFRYPDAAAAIAALVR